MKLTYFSICLSLFFLLPSFVGAQTVSSKTFGFTKLDISSGIGNAKQTSLISIPLLGEPDLNGAAFGRITSVGTATISSYGVKWSPGELSQPAKPHLIEITSGPAQGLMLLISTVTPNTQDTVTIEEKELIKSGPLNSLGIAEGPESGDTFRILPVDTLASFFGTPEETLIKGGSSASTADVITLVTNGSASSYFFNTTTTPPQWVRLSLGGTPSNHVPITPYTGIQYSRIHNTPLEFLVTGTVPSVGRKVGIKNSGVTLLSSYWASDQSLAGLGLENMGSWLTGVAPSQADTVVVVAGGSATTYFFDGTNWRRVAFGAPISNTTLITLNSSLLINKKGGLGGYSFFDQPAPYQLPE